MSTTTAHATVSPHRVVIVGGGAGGLALAAGLGEGPGSRGELDVMLVDGSRTHVWKPLLHEVAAGALASQSYEVDFLQQARKHHFRYQLGRMAGLDRAAREVLLEPLLDESGQEIVPARRIAYDTLVLAVGSVVNDFNVPGVAEHAMALNGADDARRFQQRLVAACTRAELQATGPIDIVIVGGGATGVELAAEVAEAVGEIASFGSCLRRLERPARIRIVESGTRLVSALPEEASAHIKEDLERRGVDVMLGQQVKEVAADHVRLASGERLPTSITVWAAGIRGPETAARLDGLPITPSRQITVHGNLQTVGDPHIFALGDCSRVTTAGDKPWPPTAQVAQQQARFLVRHLPQHLLHGQAVPDFVYHDRGVLVSIGHRHAVGTLVGALTGRRFLFEGLVARVSYGLLHRRHLATLLGWMPAALSAFGIWLAGRSRPRVKLH